MPHLSSPSVSASPATLLVVDDTPANLQLLGKVLTAKGYRVRKSLSGAIAVQACQFDPPDLVLLDVLMPEMNGYEVCRLLKGNPITANIPVIFISALNQLTDKTRAFADGGVDYITKPFEEGELLARIENQITLRRQQCLLEEHNRQLQGEIARRQAAETRLQQQITQEKLLTKLTEVIHVAPSLADLLATLTAELKAHLGIDQVLIYSLDPEAASYRDAIPAPEPTAALPPPPPFAGEDRLLIMDNPVQLSCRDQLGKWLSNHGGEACLLIPITTADRRWGLMALHHHHKPHLWTAGEITLVRQVVRQLGVAIRQHELVEELQRVNGELFQQSRIDPLTQVGNRRYFDSYLHQEWTDHWRHPGESLSLLLIDIDYFKAYNDTYGHLEGDRCLKIVAQVLDEAVQRPRDRVFRYGGEEFALVLPSTNRAGAEQVVDRIHRHLAQRQITHRDSPISPFVTVSIGGITTQAPETTINDYIRQADIALYVAKANGRNCAHWGGELSPSPNAGSPETRKIGPVVTFPPTGAAPHE